jgi:hypothetical protein
MHAWKFGAAAYLLLAHVGCIDGVTLGRECLERTGDCAPLQLGEPGSPIPMIDASFFDAPPTLLDARVDDAAPDAYVEPLDAGRPATLPLENGSFELTGGRYGALALEAFDPIPLGGNVSAPWAACRLGFSVLQSADAERGSGAGDVTPREGAALIEGDVGIAAALSGLQQRLPSPLVGGVRYAFRVDARAAAGSAVTLELRGTNINCSAGTKLSDLGALSESWTSSCVSFVAPADFTTLVLMPAARGTSRVATPRVFFDALRRDDSCP